MCHFICLTMETSTIVHYIYKGNFEHSFFTNTYTFFSQVKWGHQKNSCILHLFGPLFLNRSIRNPKINRSLPLVVWHFVVQFERVPFTFTQVILQILGKFLFLATLWTLIPERFKLQPHKSIPAFLFLFPVHGFHQLRKCIATPFIILFHILFKILKLK